MTSSSTEEQLLRRLEDLEKREKDRQRDELLKAAFAAQLEKVRAETERKEERMRAETEGKLLEERMRAALEKQAMRAESEKQARQAEIEKQSTRAEIEKKLLLLYPGESKHLDDSQV